MLRQYKSTDLDAVRDLHAVAFERLAAGHHTPGQLDAHRALTRTVAYAADLLSSHLALACGPDAVMLATAGWIGVAEQPGTARIRKVFVHPDMARRGLASRLVLDAEDRARAAGHTHLIVRANVNAVPLYRALGYRLLHEGQMDTGAGLFLPVMFMEKR